MQITAEIKNILEANKNMNGIPASFDQKANALEQYLRFLGMNAYDANKEARQIVSSLSSLSN